MASLFDLIVNLQLSWLIPSADEAQLNLKAVSGYEVVQKIRSAVQIFGLIQSFKMYHDSSNYSLSNLRSELCSSGVTLIDCPSNGRKEAATKMMIGMYFEYTTFFPPDVFYLQWMLLRIRGTIRPREQLLSFLATETWRIWLVPSGCASMTLSSYLPMERIKILLIRPR